METWKSVRWGNNRKREQGASIMARIIVTTDQSEQPNAPVLLDERVCAEHLSDDHSAAQLMQRLGWAITDAEDTERGLRGRAPSR
jgi:hypothetical protein